MIDINEIAERISKEYTSAEILYVGLAGSKTYNIPTAQDIDISVIVTGDESFPHILRDDTTGVHVFLRSVGFINRLIAGKVQANLNSPTLTGLSKEACEAIGLDYFAHLEEIKKIVAKDALATFCSPYLVTKEENGDFKPTRQSKGLYHGLAFMYKVKNQSFDLTTKQLVHLQEAHDRTLPTEILDEVYDFYDIPGLIERGEHL